MDDSRLGAASELPEPTGRPNQQTPAEAVVVSGRAQGSRVHRLAVLAPCKIKLSSCKLRQALQPRHRPRSDFFLIG